MKNSEFYISSIIVGFLFSHLNRFQFEKKNKSHPLLCGVFVSLSGVSLYFVFYCGTFISGQFLLFIQRCCCVFCELVLPFSLTYCSWYLMSLRTLAFEEKFLDGFVYLELEVKITIFVFGTIWLSLKSCIFCFRNFVSEIPISYQGFFLVLFLPMLVQKKTNLNGT